MPVERIEHVQLAMPAGGEARAALVADLGALVTRLRDAGVDIVDDEPLEGYERVYVSDPFGNRIELMEQNPAA